MTSASYSLGYHYTDSVKISVGSVIKPVLSEEGVLAKLRYHYKKGDLVEVGLMAKLHYHHKIEGTDITPYIAFGIGGATKVVLPAPQDQNQEQDMEGFFSYQIGAGINLPLSSRASVFAGYKLQKLQELSHGVELGMSFNL